MHLAKHSPAAALQPVREASRLRPRAPRLPNAQEASKWPSVMLQ